MSEVNQEIPLVIGMLGWSAEDITVRKTGYCWFPVGPKDDKYAGGRVWLRVKVTAIEDVRAKRDVIVADDANGVKEHTPVELSYEKAAGGFQRVTEVYPLPTTLGSKAITHYTKLCTTLGNTELIAAPASGYKIRVHSFSYSNKQAASVDVGMRFGDSGDVKHRFNLAADGGNITHTLAGAAWEGAESEALNAYLAAAAGTGVIFNVGYSVEVA